MRFLLCLVLLALGLAGCTQSLNPSLASTSNPADHSSTTPTGATTATCGDGTQCCPPPTHWVSYGCIWPASLRLLISSPDAVVVQVPYPHGSWCLTGEDWMANATVDHGSVRLAQSDRGQVLEFTLNGSGIEGSRGTYAEGSATIYKAQQTECQTLRYDPWSIEPDPAANTTEVHLSEAAKVSLEVQDSNGGGCWFQTNYERDDQPASAALDAGWDQLPAHGGTVCV